MEDTWLASRVRRSESKSSVEEVERIRNVRD